MLNLNDELLNEILIAIKSQVMPNNENNVTKHCFIPDNDTNDIVRSIFEVADNIEEEHSLHSTTKVKNNDKTKRNPCPILFVFTHMTCRSCINDGMRAPIISG